MKTFRVSKTLKVWIISSNGNQTMSEPAIHSAPETPKIKVERVQTGVRIEKRMLKVLKALAEYLDMSLGDLLEGIVLHAFEGKCAFDENLLQRIAMLKEVYEMDYDATASHRMIE
jgi:hypothetical protein